jgi:putative FmdB family regulatory protein
VPTYEYECSKCRRVFEVRQRISEPALTTHEGCGGEVHRLISPAPFILKGEGWYVTDYPSEARKKAKDAEKSSNGGDAKTTEAKSDAKSTTATPSAPASAPPPKTD